MNSPKEEQEICVNCGFCCDGTLFDRAVLEPDEKGNLPQEMEDSYFKIGNKEYFKLPCSYFDGKCTIYNQKKASICSAFRCKLLRDFSKNEVTQTSASEIIKNAISLREEISFLYQDIFCEQQRFPFRDILLQVRDLKESEESDIPKRKEFQLLKTKTIILEALLTRHFKSKEKFYEMIEQPTSK